MLRLVGARAFSQASALRMAAQPEPKTAAANLLNAIPGNSVVSKTAVATAGAGLAIVGVSKEYILLHPETIVLGAFAGFLYLAHGQLTPIIQGAMASRAEDIKKGLLTSAENQKVELLKEIEQTKNAAVIVDIMKSIYTLKKEIVVMQTKLQERNAQKAVLGDFKQQLDQLSAIAAAQRALEHQKIVETLKSRILEAIKDASFQDKLLKKCVSDIETISIA